MQGDSAPNLARVHVEVPPAVDASDDEHQEPEDPGAWTGRLVQQLSGIWGYAFIGSAANLSFVTALSSLQWTDWGEGGVDRVDAASSAAASQLELKDMPKHNKVMMGILFSVLIPVCISARTAFAIAQGDPHPLPLRGWFSWKYAPYCFISMVSSTLIVAGLTYALPVSMGGRIEYYFGESLSMLLEMTLCVVFTAEVMKFLYKRDQRRGAPPRTTSNVAANLNALPEDDEKNEEEEKQRNCFGDLVHLLNLIALASTTLGCRFHLHCALKVVVLLTLDITLYAHTDPLLILPAYRAASTTDAFRLLISCVLHPLAQEMIM